MWQKIKKKVAKNRCKTEEVIYANYFEKSPAANNKIAKYGFKSASTYISVYSQTSGIWVNFGYVDNAGDMLFDKEIRSFTNS